MNWKKKMNVDMMEVVTMMMKMIGK